MIKLAATPIRTVMFRPSCAYCGKPEKHWVNCDVQLAILACGDPEHQAWAERDAQAWLGRTENVKPKHYRQDPLFQLTDLLSRDVAVPRTRAAQCDACGGRAAYPSGGGPKCAKCAGTPDREGWTISRPHVDDAALMSFCREEGLWAVPVCNRDEPIRKYIPVRDLKMSLPEEKHGLVDAFEARLKAGFYSTAMRAHEEAVEAQKEMENPGSTGARREIADYFEYRLHPVHGPVRVFSPPSVQEVPAEVDPSST
jgi:hypothetical protein